MRPPGTIIGFLSILFIGSGCGPGNEEDPRLVPAVDEMPAFANRVWRVEESTGMSPGQLVVFLSDGTLVFASPFDRPALGTWSFDGELLTMVEEGMPYRVEILAVSDGELQIRSHNPGGFVETRLVPAQRSIPGSASP